MARLIQGGYIREIGPGLFSFLPIGLRVMHNIIEARRKELLTLEGEEILLPAVTPAALWEETGRDQLIAEEITYLLDKREKSLVLSPSHEEAVLAMARQSFSRADQLPAFLFQFQMKFRDDTERPQGLEKAREFMMADAFSLHTSEVGLNNFFPKVHAAFLRIFRHFGLSVIVSQGAAEYSAGKSAFEILLPTRRGEHTLVRCKSCGFLADQDVAVGLFKTQAAKLLALEPIGSKLGKTSDEIHSTTGVPKSRLIQCTLFLALHGLCLAVYRGDQVVSQDKLCRLLGEPVLRAATDEEVAEMGLAPWYVSPLNMSNEIRDELGIRIIVDSAVADSTNLTIPGNQEGLYYANANFGRDFSADIVGDISRVDEHCRCYHCGGELSTQKVVKLANLAHLGDGYSRSMEFSIVDDRGDRVYPHLGTYGIGIGRLMSTVAEFRSDHKSLCWPLSLAPFKAQMVVVGRGHTIHQIADHVYSRISSLVLWDERKIPVLAKFKDADRLGIPIRLVINAASLSDGCVMLSHRLLCPPVRVPFHKITQKIEELESLEQEIGPQSEAGLRKFRSSRPVRA